MKKSREGQNRRGFSLIELIVALVILSIVIGATMSALLSVQRGQYRQGEVVRSEDALRVAHTALLTVVRGAAANPRSMTGGGAPRIEANPMAQATFNNIRVVSDYNPPDADVADMLEDVQFWVASDTLFARWQAGGPTAAVAYPINTLLFQYYDRAGALIPAAANVGNAVKVQVTMTSFRHSRPNDITTRSLWIYLRNRT